MPEKLTFEKCVGNGPGIHGDERFSLAQAMLMDLLGQQILSGAVLPCNQHRCIGRSDLEESVTYSGHLVTSTPVHLLLVRPHLFLRRGLHGLISGRRQSRYQLLIVPGLGNEIKGSSSHSLDGQGYVGIGREENNFSRRRELFDLLCPVEAFVAVVDAGSEIHVQEHHIRLEVLKL